MTSLKSAARRKTADTVSAAEQYRRRAEERRAALHAKRLVDCPRGVEFFTITRPGDEGWREYPFALEASEMPFDAERWSANLIGTFASFRGAPVYPLRFEHEGRMMVYEYVYPD